MRRMGITSKRVVSPHLQHAYSNHCGIAPTLEILSTTFCQPSLGRQAMEFGGFSGRRAYRDTRQLALRPRSPDQAKRGQSATAIFELRGVSTRVDGRRTCTPPSPSPFAPWAEGSEPSRKQASKSRLRVGRFPRFLGGIPRRNLVAPATPTVNGERLLCALVASTEPPTSWDLRSSTLLEVTSRGDTTCPRRPCSWHATVDGDLALLPLGLGRHLTAVVPLQLRT